MRLAKPRRSCVIVRFMTNNTIDTSMPPNIAAIMPEYVPAKDQSRKPVIAMSKKMS